MTEYLLEGKESSRVALRLLNKDHTYGELRAASDALAGCMLEAGGGKGDRALLVSENSFFWVAAYLGILKAGLVCVPLPATLSTEDVNYIVQLTGARFALLQRSYALKNSAPFRQALVITDAPAELPDFGAVASLAGLSSAGSGAPSGLPSVSPGDLAALMFTSGSTGRPRGVMVSHGNIMANTESIIWYLELTPEDSIMTVLPFHYCFGTSLLHTHLRVGGSLVLDSRFMYPEAILQRMLETGCTGFAGVPSHYQVLLRNSTLRKKTFPRLRYVQQAGGHLAPSFLRELRSALPGTRIFVMYGQTEATARLSFLPPEMLEEKMGSIGKGMPGLTLRVLNEAGEPVRHGNVGEIVAEGENITSGYWKDPVESRNSFRNGKLYTGDLATVDEDGYIFIVDRAKDFLKCGGKRTSCRQLEEQLLEFEALLEAAVVGIPDELLGEAVKAFVVSRKADAGGLEERVRLFCKERMPPQLVPKEIVVLKALPKNSSGKVLKQSLKTL